jgi:hypothetical protein
MRGSRASFASTCTASAIAIVIAACSRENAATTSSPSPSASHSTSSSSSPTPSIAPYTFPLTSPSAWGGAPVSAKAVGTTSLVLKVKLDDGLTCAFKPRSHRPLGTTRYKGEIAAYRIARALGIDNVPLAIPRTFTAESLRAALASGPDAAKADELVVDADGGVRGALIPWIKRERFDIDIEPNRSRWMAWLTSNDPLPAGQTAIARQISTMLLFDYFTANWDRWSGDNIAIDRATGTILFVDNDGAFYETPDMARLADALGLIRRMTRFSRSFVTALRAFGRSALEDALGREEAGVALLTPRVIDAADARRAKVVAIIDAKIAKQGEANVLAFE